jgi:hypothetical protein
MVSLSEIFIDDYFGIPLWLKKVLYRRKPLSFSNYKSELNLIYKSFTEIGEENFIEAFRKVYEPDIFEADPEKALIRLRRMAIRTNQFYPDDWVVAYLRNEAFGVSMPLFLLFDIQLDHKLKECDVKFSLALA